MRFEFSLAPGQKGKRMNPHVSFGNGDVVHNES